MELASHEKMILTLLDALQQLREGQDLTVIEWQIIRRNAAKFLPDEIQNDPYYKRIWS